MNRTALTFINRIKHVHGARIFDSRQALRYNDNGDLVFISATFGVIYNRHTQSQLLYAFHNRAVISLEIDSLGRIAASGEYFEPDSLVDVHLWDARTAQPIKRFENIHRHGVSNLAFSSSGEYLVSLGMDPMHSIVVFHSPSRRWVDGYSMASCSVSPRKLYWILFADEEEFPITIGGAGTMLFFRVTGRTLERKKGIFGKKKKLQPVLCGVLGDADSNSLAKTSIVTGTVTGHMYVWVNQRVVKSITAHDAPIYSICKIGPRYATGCKEGLVKIWSDELEPLLKLGMRHFNPPPETMTCHALWANAQGSRLAVGMRGGEVYEFCLATQSCHILVEGHTRLELHGLDVNPSNSDEYVTSGDDGVVRVWSISRRVCLRQNNLESASRAVAWSPDGERIIVGVGGDPSSATKEGENHIWSIIY
jgi:WD40 repeat protein